MTEIKKSQIWRRKDKGFLVRVVNTKKNSHGSSKIIKFEYVVIDPGRVSLYSLLNTDLFKERYEFIREGD